jgi:eukaryotic translation initiation factor 2C
LVNIGGKEKDWFVPAETCSIDTNRIGNAPSGTFDVAAQKVMSRNSALTAEARALIISRQAYRPLGVEQIAPLLKAFGIELGSELLPIRGRVLAPPIVAYPSGNPIISNGAWSNRDSRFSHSVDIENCAVLVINTDSPGDFSDPPDTGFTNALVALRTACLARGMRMRPDVLPRSAFMRMELQDLNAMGSSTSNRLHTMKQVEDAVKGLIGTRRTPVLFIFLSTHHKRLYSEIKRICDIQIGVPTICVSSANVKQAVIDGASDRSCLFSGLAHKANVKLGGINHRIDGGGLKLLDASMLVGLSVNVCAGQPTVTSIVATPDDTFANYPASIRIQEGKGYVSS